MNFILQEMLFIIMILMILKYFIILVLYMQEIFIWDEQMNQIF